MASVGVIGLGIMGGSIAANLVKASFAVTGYDVLVDKTAALAQQGGRAATAIAEVAQAADVIVTSLPSVAALDDVVAALGSSAKRGTVVIECSTFPIEDKLRAHDTLAQAGVAVLDCPLSGTGAQAVTKDLVVYASGARSAYDRSVDVFAGFSRANYFLGAFGNGSKMKFVANLLVSIHNVATAEAFTLGMKAGLDPQQILEVVGAGAGVSRVFQLRGPMMVENSYGDASMKLDVWQKDVKVIGEFAAKLGCPTPLFSAALPIYAAAIAQGRGLEDTAAVCAVLEEMARVVR
ncbi:MAG: NAD(P)-dependent oxidoreductase [Alphaproteobacteria bacterium]|nr:NAD(P)-dependent oxidoreductase [Alphaproteobacteria bacterium]